jgi:hypothetical protein
MQRLIAWAARTGPTTAELIEAIMASRAHPEQGYRSCLGIMCLSGRYPQPHMEVACRADHRRTQLSQPRIDPCPRPGNHPTAT